MANLSRRRFMGLLGLGVGGGAVLSACGATPTPQVIERVVEKEVTKIVEGTPQIVKETVVVRETVVVEQGAPQQTGEGVILRYSHWGDPDEADLWRQLAQEYTDANEGVTVVTMHIPQQYETKIQAMFAANDPPDVIFIQDEPFPKYADKGLYMNMDPLVERDAGELALDDFFPLTQEMFMWDAEAQQVNQGTRYAMPSEGGVILWFANLDVFEDAGAEFPEENGRNWTVDDFFTAMQKIVKLRPDGGMDRGGFIWPGTVYNMPLVWTLSNMEADYLTPDKTACLLDTKASVEAHQTLWNWMFEERFCPLAGQDMVGVSGVDQFTSGKIGAQLTGPWYFPQLRRATDAADGSRTVNWDILHMPRNAQGNRWTRQSFDGWAIATAIPEYKKEPAWQYIKYMLSEEGQARITKLGRAMPVRPSIARSEVFNRPDTPENEWVFEEGMGYANYQPITKYWSEMWQIITKYYDIIYNPQTKDELTVEEACSRMAAGINELLESGELPANY